MITVEDMFEVLHKSINRIESDHAQEYMDKAKNDPMSRDIVFGMYMVVSSINNDLQGEFGDDEVAKAIGIAQLADKLEKYI